VLPGMVDSHVHLMDPGDTTREDFPTGTAAAAARGVTTIIEHTHARPVRTLTEFEDKRSHLEGRSNVDYALAAHVWPNHLADLETLWRSGIAQFKIFTCTTHGVPGLDAAHLEKAFSTIAGFDGACLLHCEDESITSEAEKALRAEDRSDHGIIPAWRNRSAELVAVSVAIVLAQTTGVRATIAHVSSPEVVELIEAARRNGADLAAEACPQYFALRESDILHLGALRKFTPPARARSNADEQQMWNALRSGSLTHISTDHAPSTIHQKQQDSIWDAPFGLPGLDTTMPFLVDAAVQGRLSFEDVVRVYAAAPAKRYGLHPRKGALESGFDADVVLVDPSGSWDLTNDSVISKAGWSPFAPRRFAGRVERVFLRGQEISVAGEPTGERGGVFVPGPGAIVT